MFVKTYADGITTKVRNPFRSLKKVEILNMEWKIEATGGKNTAIFTFPISPQKTHLHKYIYITKNVSINKFPLNLIKVENIVILTLYAETL
jgi:hypothetical protein